MKTISEINELSRQGLEIFRNEINSTMGSSPEVPFSVLAALRTTGTDTGLPVSNALFYVILHRMTEGSGVFGTIVCSSTFWLDDENIKFWCSFSFGGSTKIFFLTQEQGELLLRVLHLNIISTTFPEELASIADGVLPTQEFTPAELTNPIVREYIIPRNSESTTVAENTSRFSGATWFEEIQKKTIMLAGLGGIGSYVCFLLARMQPTSLFLYDDDVVEAANMSGQLYGNSDIGRYKVDAMSDMVAQYASFYNVFSIRERFTDRTEPTDIMICGFDNMDARQKYFRRWKYQVSIKASSERCKCLFIDGRLSAEYLQVYCITGDDVQAMDKYESTALFSDDEADETVCSYKQTTYMANMIGSIIVNLFTNFVANEVAGAPIRELPFLTTYDGNNMQFKIE